MKKHLAVLAATAVLGVTSAFAANPFADVTPQDWAYQAVAQLASQGIVNGYPDGTFQGQSNITRYEMAQMVAKAMARQERVDAEQNAIINRLANEFAAELNNLGVRVSTLENKVGNFKFTGDARLRYQGTNDGRDSKFDYRGRVKFEATVNDNTKAVVRLTSGAREFGNGTNVAVSPTVTNNDAQIDRVYVQHNFGKYATGIVGRQNLLVGNGLIYDDTFDGAALAFGKDKLNASVAYGYAVEGEASDLSRAENTELTVYQVNVNPTDRVAVKGFYVAAHEEGADNVYGTSVDVYAGGHGKIWLGGEFVKTETVGATGEGWTAGLGYGNYDISKAGSWGVKGQYFNLKQDAPIVSSTWNQPDNRDYKGWLATVDYAVAKNVGLSAYATIDSKDQAKNDKAEYYRAELNYKF